MAQPAQDTAAARPTEDFCDPIVSTSSCELISQGAEAVRSVAQICICGSVLWLQDLTAVLRMQRVWAGQLLGRSVVLKQRFRKKYRHPILDNKLNSGRIKQVRAEQGSRFHHTSLGFKVWLGCYCAQLSHIDLLCLHRRCGA